MADDFARIQSNVQKLIDLDAPEDDIDGYLAEEGLTPETFRAKVLTPKPPPPLPEGNFRGAVNAGADSITDAIMMGWADEAEALQRAGMVKLFGGKGEEKPFWEVYDDRIKSIRGEQKQRSEEHPIASGVGTVMGTLGALGGSAAGNLGRNLVVGAEATGRAAPGTGWGVGKTVFTKRPAGIAPSENGAWWAKRRADKTPMGPPVAPPPVSDPSKLVKALKAVGNVGLNVGIGATAGAVGGAGGGEDADSRIQGAGAGALVGGGLGLAFPVAARAVGMGIGQVRNILGLADQERIAEQLLLKKLGQDDFTAEKAGHEVADLYDDSRKGPVGLLDVGPQTQRLGRVVEAAPGSGSTKLTQFVHGRQEGQGSRLREGVNKTLADDDARGTLDALQDKQRLSAKKDYETAYETEIPFDTKLLTMLSDDLAKQGLRKGLRIAEIESMADGVPFNPQEWVPTRKSGGTSLKSLGDSPATQPMPKMEMLDAVKKGLDDLLEPYRDKVSGRLVLDNEGRAIDTFRRKYLEKLDELNPAYATARANWAGPARAKDAVQTGRQFIRGDSEDFAINIDHLTPGDRPFMQVGVARELRSIIEKTRDGHNKVDRIFGNEDIRNRLKYAFGDSPEGKKAFDAFERQMKAEARMYKSRQVATGNSATKRIEADMDEANGASSSLLGEAAGAVVRGEGTPGIMRSVLSRVSNKSRGISEKAGEDLARMLIETKPDEIAKIIQRLQRRETNTALSEQAANALVKGLLATTAQTSSRPLGLLE